MAKDEKKIDAKQTDKSTAPVTAASPIYGDNEQGWAEIGEQYLYKAEHYVVETVGKVQRCWRPGPGGHPQYSSPIVRGIPFALIVRDGSKHDLDDYMQLAIQLTRDTELITGEDEAQQKVVVRAGETVLFTVTEALQRVASYANLEHEQVEVSIRAVQKEPLKGGREIWRWSVRENPVRQKRERRPELPKLGTLARPDGVSVIDAPAQN